MIILGRYRFESEFNQKILQGIRILIENKNYRSAVILVLSGIDVMAYLSIPSSRSNQDCHDYIEWSDKYINLTGKEKVSGLELYISRCIMLNSYSDYSNILSKGNCRTIIYKVKSDSVSTNNCQPKDIKSFVYILVQSLAEAFFKGVDRFLDDILLKENMAKVAEERLMKINQNFSDF